MSKTISAGRTPKIHIENVAGDLSLVGWDGEDILLKGDDDEMSFTQDGETITISCNDDISLRVPKAASVTIKTITGDASIRGVMGGVELDAIEGDLSIRDAMGDIELDEVEGDLSIRDVSSVSINTVHSDFSLRGAKGHLSVKSALRDVSIRNVDGNVSLVSVANDLALRDVRGNINANVAEDVVLYIDPQPGNAYSVTAGDDILLVMPPKANATLTLNGDEIDVDWRGVEKDDEATSRVVTLGNGSSTVTLNAGGDIRVTNNSDAGESAQDFGNFAGIDEDWSGFGERISRHVEQATRKATRKVEEAARRVDQIAGRRAQAKVNFGVGRWNWDLSSKGVPMPSRPQATDEERMAILKMLQDKKITAEEAEKLLSSLEGGS